MGPPFGFFRTPYHYKINTNERNNSFLLETCSMIVLRETKRNSSGEEISLFDDLNRIKSILK